MLAIENKQIEESENKYKSLAKSFNNETLQSTIDFAYSIVVKETENKNYLKALDYKVLIYCFRDELKNRECEK